MKLREHQRLPGLKRSSGEGYRYERELEEFLRYSPSVKVANAAPTLPANVAPGGEESAAQVAVTGAAQPAAARPKPRAKPKPAPRAPAPPMPDYADLESEEIIALLGDLDTAALERLREHEAASA